MSAAPTDIFIVGGGINGAGIARDAAGRGYSVHLAEMDDLASGTSSAATKLVHGGLRYLEHYAFRLVRESLLEREVLWAMAPHIIRPMRFVLPHHEGLRPAWMLRLGLLLYDHIGGRRRLPPARTLDLRRDAAGRPLRDGYGLAFEFSDCWVDDARLVVLTAKDAAERGATIVPRSKFIGATKEDGLWRVTVRAMPDGEVSTHTARLLVNAAGPWADRVQGAIAGKDGVHNVRLVKGSHIVVRQLFTHDRGYLFQNADGRIAFALPYEDHFTLIGTTDTDFHGDPADAAIGSEEITYLCDLASEYFARPVTRADVVWAFAGVRPLYDDGASRAQEATRDYVLKIEAAEGEPRLLNVFGGKLTTYRRLAEEAMLLVDRALGRKTSPWTADAPLPGGDFAADGFDELVRRLMSDYRFLIPGQAERLARLYGTRAWQLLGGARHRSDLGADFGGDFTQIEVDYLMREEWALTAEDILWRRTKLGLHVTERDERALTAYLAAQTEDHPA